MRLWGKKETYIDIPSSFPSGKKYIDRDFLCGPVVKYLPSSAGDGVQSLVWELRSHMLQGN